MLRGNPGKRAINKREPQPALLIPDPPDHLSERARRVWDEAGPVLYRMKVLTEADGLALEQLCENYAEIVELRAVVAAEGRTQACETNAGGVMIRAHPAVAQLSDAERRFASMLDRFGLNPASRAKVSTVGDDANANPFANLGNTKA